MILVESFTSVKVSVDTVVDVFVSVAVSVDFCVEVEVIVTLYGYSWQ